MRFSFLASLAGAASLSISCSAQPAKPLPERDFNHAAACTMVSAAVSDFLSNVTEQDPDYDLFKKLSGEVRAASLEDFKMYAEANKMTEADVEAIALAFRAELNAMAPEEAISFLYTRCSDYASSETVAAFKKRMEESAQQPEAAPQAPLQPEYKPEEPRIQPRTGNTVAFLPVRAFG